VCVATDTQFPAHPAHPSLPAYLIKQMNDCNKQVVDSEASKKDRIYGANEAAAPGPPTNSKIKGPITQIYILFKLIL